MELLEAASRFNLPILIMLCENFIQHGIDFKNVVSIYQASEIFEANQLKEYCRHFILTHYQDVASAVEAHELTFIKQKITDPTHKKTSKRIRGFTLS